MHRCWGDRREIGCGLEFGFWLWHEAGVKRNLPLCRLEMDAHTGLEQMLGWRGSDSDAVVVCDGALENPAD
jgi:hypothetical protein